MKQINVIARKCSLLFLKMSEANSIDGGTNSSSEASPLSDRQRARIERNRQRALMLRQSKHAYQPYTKKKPEKK